MGSPVKSNVTVGEGRNEARPTTHTNKHAGEELVERVTAAEVGEERAEEQVRESCASGEEPDEVAEPRECSICNSRSVRAATFSHWIDFGGTLVG